jgi:hypothetical protein
MRKNEEQPVGWVIFSAVLVVGLGLLGLALLGWGVYYIVDIVCVNADPNNASAICRDIH